MSKAEAKAVKSVLFFFFPRSHRLPVGSLYGGMISAASHLGIDSILVRYGSVGSIKSILSPSRQLTEPVIKKPERVLQSSAPAKAEDRPIVAERLDYRLLRWLIHLAASPFQLFAVVLLRRPKRIVVRDLPHALLAVPAALLFRVPLLFVADSPAWSEPGTPDPLTGKMHQRSFGGSRDLLRRIAIGVVAIVSDTIIVPSEQLRYVFERRPGSAGSAKSKVNLEREAGQNRKVIASRFPLLLTAEPPVGESGRLGLLRQHSFPEETFLIAADVTDCSLRTIELFIRTIHALTLDQPGELPVTVLLLGEIDDRERIRSLVTGFGLRDAVHLTGWVDSPAAIYGWADLVISLPSTAGIGPSALGAARLGIAVAAPDDPDGRCVFGAGPGLYADQHVENLSSWLRELISDPAKVAALKEFTAGRGRDLAELERELMIKALL